jgi:hypothetical protein
MLSLSQVFFDIYGDSFLSPSDSKLGTNSLHTESSHPGKLVLWFKPIVLLNHVIAISLHAQP